jgi:hypothetical protein
MSGLVHLHTPSFIQPITLTSATGKPYVFHHSLAKKSEVVRGMLGADDAVSIPMSIVADEEMVRLQEYIASNATCTPLTRIRRPLYPGPLTENGVPSWAEMFAADVSKRGRLTQLRAAADFLGVVMLVALMDAQRALMFREEHRGTASGKHTRPPPDVIRKWTTLPVFLTPATET